MAGRRSAGRVCPSSVGLGLRFPDASASPSRQDCISGGGVMSGRVSGILPHPRRSRGYSAQGSLGCSLGGESLVMRRVALIRSLRLQPPRAAIRPPSAAVSRCARSPDWTCIRRPVPKLARWTRRNDPSNQTARPVWTLVARFRQLMIPGFIHEVCSHGWSRKLRGPYTPTRRSPSVHAKGKDVKDENKGNSIVILCGWNAQRCRREQL